jgi:AraC family transcriptional regulator, regulatory protein of adaptative response / DNA-3-methyladenine glycosylase II
VALASGFGSLRRFNETFQRLFGRSPSAMRRRHPSASVTSKRSDGVTVLLRYKPPYDWNAALSCLRARRIPGVEAISGDQYARAIKINGACGSVAVTHSEANALRAEIRFAKLSSLPEIIARLRRLFDLTADPHAIGAHLSRDPLLAPLVAARPGVRVPGTWDGFELAVRTLFGQQLTIEAASGQVEKLVAAYGEPLKAESGAHGLTHVFPDSATLATADLRKLGVPVQRARAIKSLSVALAADPLLFSTQRSLEQAVANLRSLPGIGEWTAQYVAMRELREPDAFPATDMGLLRAVSDASGHPVARRDLLARAERWRPWRAYAAHHLWSSTRTFSAASRDHAASS